MSIDDDLQDDMIALDWGIIPPSLISNEPGSLDALFNSLDEKSARIIKRKFRKFKRKLQKELGLPSNYNFVVSTQRLFLHFLKGKTNPKITRQLPKQLPKQLLKTCSIVTNTNEENE